MHILFTLFLALMISGCSSLNVNTDYDPDVDMTAPKNFAVVHKAAESENTLVTSRIITALKENLTAKGYKETSQETADFLVTFHTGVTTNQRVDRDYQYINMYPYSYGPGFGRYGGYGGGYGGAYVMPKTRTHTYKTAKLIVDIVIPVKNQIIWRGVAEDQLKSLKSPEDETYYINNVISELLKKFPK